MEQSGKPKRTYHSQRRQEQARETRQRILEASLKQFSQYGYSGATIEAIAQGAGVSPLTVFSTYGNKRSILAALVDFTVGGDQQPIPVLQRPGPQAVMRETDPIRQVRAFAADISKILERVSPVFEIMRMAAKTEPEINELLKKVLENRFNNLGVFVQNLASRTPLRDGIDLTLATEIVWAIASPDFFRLMTQDRGWTKEKFAAWLGDTLVRLLLEI